ncbi:hypothetical protein EVAR_25994_1 [Eumeta japonica]|uniref:Agrin n=1 Tax=Eumeta variegata TaxID=151549 RepID=A0A4C1V1H7_EUMVA|nr:hypothetical protein EVAR_25994_1 [Eumeta japonica]
MSGGAILNYNDFVPELSTPRFSGNSWLALRALRGAYKRVRLRVRVRPERARGVLLLTGERDDLTGDYLAIVLRQGHVELSYKRPPPDPARSPRPGGLRPPPHFVNFRRLNFYLSELRKISR